MHHDVIVWGPNVEESNPQRFLYMAGSSKSNSGCSVTATHQLSAAFPSFRVDAAECSLRHFAQAEAVSLIAAVVNGFVMLPPKGKNQVAWNLGRDVEKYCLRCWGRIISGVRVKLERRQGLDNSQMVKS